MSMNALAYFALGYLACCTTAASALGAMAYADHRKYERQ